MGTIATATATLPDSETTLPLHRLDVETYDAIVASGALEGHRVELLDGVLVEMSPQSRPHAVVIARLNHHFTASRSCWVHVQLPLQVRPDSEPEPDLAIFAQEPPPDRHPLTALLAIEVAVSTQLIDRNVKGPLYARADIPTYWLIDLPARTVEVYTQPGEGGYARCDRYRADRTLPCGLEGVADVELAALFDGIEG